MLSSIGVIPFEAAQRYGDKTALVLPDRQLSFNELDALTNRCANALVNLGVKPGDMIRITRKSATAGESFYYRYVIEV